MQQPTKNMRLQLTMVQRRGANGEGWEGSAIPSFWGQSSWEGIKKLNEIDEFTNYFFSLPIYVIE
jgi:hypothetical protein